MEIIINRSAMIVYCKPRMLQWINKLDSMKSDDKLTIEELNAEPTIFLIPEFEDEENAYLFIEKNKSEIFKTLLLAWPEKGELNINIEEENFSDWFDILLTPEVNDMLTNPIEKEDMEL